MLYTSFSVVVSEPSLPLPLWAWLLTVVGGIAVAVLAIVFMEHSSVGSKMRAFCTVVGLLIPGSAIALIVTDFARDQASTSSWYGEVVEAVDGQYSKEELHRSKLLDAVRSQNVTTLQAVTASHGIVDIHVDGRAVTFTPSASAPTKIMQHLQTFCETGDGPTTPQEKQACTAFEMTPNGE